MPIPTAEIVEGFRERNCVLLLGPSFAKNKQGVLLQSGLIGYFNEKQLEVEEDIDNFISCTKPTKARAYVYLREYYRDYCAPSSLHQQLALIPCHLYISINPDLLMKQALENCGVEHEYSYYVKGQTAEEVAKPTDERPLLYNLFGSIDNSQSLILTHEDLIQYLFSIIREFKLPQNLRNTVETATYFVFLGFNFEKWYLKLLLKLFLSDDKTSIAMDTGVSAGDKLRTFYSRNYGLKFVDDNIEEYVQSLYAECARRGMLRAVKEKSQPSIREEIKELIKRDEVVEALDKLREFLEKMNEQAFGNIPEEKQDLLNELDAHAGKLTRSEKNLRKGTISEDEANIEKNRIIEAIQTIVQNLRL